MPPPAFLVLFGGHLVVWLILLVLNFLPAVVAFARGHRHPWAILVLNVLFGWTIVGWIGCLIWAMAGRPRQDLLAPPRM